jgi:hypothetical protein
MRIESRIIFWEIKTIHESLKKICCELSPDKGIVQKSMFILLLSIFAALDIVYYIV